MKSTSTITKIKKEKPFTTMYNQALRDKDLSWQAKGLYAYLCSNSDEWSIKKAGLANMSKNGYAATDAAFKELLDKKYIVENGYDRKNGRFQGVNYEFHEIPPNSENHDSVLSPNGGFPSSVFPSSDNHELINNNSITSNTNKEQINNLNIITEQSSVAAELFDSLTEIEPIPKAKRSKKEPKEPKAPTVFQKFNEIWLKEYHPGWNYSAVDGMKMKALIKKFEKSLSVTKPNYVEDDLVNLFRVFLTKLPNFYQTQTLSVIESKYDSIIEEIKKNNGKSNSSTGRAGVTNFKFDGV